LFSNRFSFLIGLLALASLTSTAPAAINSGGVVDAASYRSGKYPNAGIAQRSIFVVFGSDLADAGLVTANAFPLGQSMGGTSIQVAVGGTTVNCYMIYTTPGQVAALLPSNTPVGDGTLTLRHGAQTFTEPIKVVAHFPSIFSQNSQGSGPASLTNFISDSNQPLNQLDQALTQGQYGIVWLTGLGAANGNDAGPPSADDLRGRYDIKVFVGGQQAELVYAGPSGCCSGVDQIVFKPQAGIAGCYVPVLVTVNGVPSNYTSASIAQSGQVCSEPGLLDSSDITSALTGGNVRLGLVSFSSVEFEAPEVNIPFQSFGGTSEFAFADFEQFTSAAFRARTGEQAFLTRNACMVFTFSGQDAVFDDAAASTGLPAGTVALQGPFGTRTLNNDSPGQYSLTLSQPGVPGIPGLPAGVLQSAPVLTPGTYKFTGSGGSGVGAFSTSRTYSGGLTWTNKDSISSIPRGQGLTVTWTGGDAGEEDAWIFGSSIAGVDVSGLGLTEEGKLQEASDAYGAAFFCQADLSRGSFTIGPEVLSALPPSASITTPFGSFGFGSLQVGSSSKVR
jgi:uncharacterized protein (TIGR03437 family)